MIGRCFAYMLICALLAGCSVVPEPLSDRELRDRAIDGTNRATANQEPVSKPIGLHEAMARAVKYNLNARIEQAEAVLKLRQLELSNMAQLPNLVADLDYSGRNNYDGSSSRSLLTGLQSLEPSTSSDRHLVKSDLRLSWNILDFGLSYVRANQAADQALIAEEKRRKAIHRLLQEVRATFWKAAAAGKLSRKLAGLDEKIRAAQLSEQAMEREGTSSPLMALTHQRELLELQIELQRLNREIATSKAQLAALMNLPPGTDFKLSLAGAPASFADTLPPAGNMMSFALLQRPELRQAGYSSRINQREAEAALLELLPGITPLLSVDYDSNSFAYEHNWVAAGAKASWNLMKIFSYPRKDAAIQAEGDTLDKKALATAMAIMMQVQVSRLNYSQAKRSFYLAQDLYDVEKKILKQMSSAHAAGSIGGHSLLRQEMRLAAAEAKKGLSYADYESAFGTLFVSLGADIGIDGIDETQPIEQISITLAHNWYKMSSPSVVGSIPKLSSH